jgi:hypothetical protein
MKLIDAMRQVDRSPDNHNHVDPEELNQALDANLPYIDWSGLNAEMSEFWLSKWLCTDTHVGDSAGFIGDELVYLRRQTARKGGHTYQFVSIEAAHRVKDLLMKHCEDKSEPVLLDQDEEIAETYKVHWANGVLVDKGLYKGQAVTHTRVGWYKELARDILVQIDETGENLIIPCDYFEIPLHLATKDTNVNAD